MAGSRLGNLIVLLGLVTVTAATTFVLSGGTTVSAHAAQPVARAAMFIGPCWHVGVSDWDCPDSMMVVGSADYITSVSVTVETRGGKRATMKLPAGVDAIFLTRQSTEKFLLSYYWATNREKAMTLTSRLARIKDPVRR
jgi:hypothetical protein